MSVVWVHERTVCKNPAQRKRGRQIPGWMWTYDRTRKRTRHWHTV